VRAATKPTYLKAPGDGMVVAAGFGMLTLALMRLAAGYGDMAYGVNKVGMAGWSSHVLPLPHAFLYAKTYADTMIVWSYCLLQLEIQ
jgi:hypothetical protein